MCILTEFYAIFNNDGGYEGGGGIFLWIIDGTFKKK